MNNKDNDISSLESNDSADWPKTASQDQNSLILQAKAHFPHASPAQIANALNLEESAVKAVLESPAGQVLSEQIEIDQATYLASIRAKALSKFSTFLERDDIKPETLLNALKFALSGVLDKAEDKKPHSLIFETVISASGQVEQRQLKATKSGDVIDAD